jgi:hypothetical protein
LPPVSATPAAYFYTIFTSVVDTGGKFATGVNDTGDKFATGVNNTGGKLRTGINDTGGKFATGVNDTLKGQCHEIFDFWLFSWISFPQASEYTSTAFSNFFENSIFAAQGAPPVSTTPLANGKNLQAEKF